MKSQEQVQTAVAEKILQFKKTENMSFQDLAEITGISQATTNAWARCTQIPNLYNAYLLADAMGMTVQELIE